MTIKRIGAVTVVAVALAFPLAACGSSPAPAPVAAPECEKWTAENWTRCADQRSDDLRNHRITPGAEPAAAQQPKSKDSGLPWWAWLLIVPAGLVGLLVLWVKLSELNDERRVARAWQKVDELDARHRARFGDDADDDDVEDYPENDDDELPENDMEFLRKATDPAPAPAPSAPPAGGNLLSSLRQQGGGAQ